MLHLSQFSAAFFSFLTWICVSLSLCFTWCRNNSVCRGVPGSPAHWGFDLMRGGSWGLQTSQCLYWQHSLEKHLKCCWKSKFEQDENFSKLPLKPTNPPTIYFLGQKAPDELSWIWKNSQDLVNLLHSLSRMLLSRRVYCFVNSSDMNVVL